MAIAAQIDFVGGLALGKSDEANSMEWQVKLPVCATIGVLPWCVCMHGCATRGCVCYKRYTGHDRGMYKPVRSVDGTGFRVLHRA